ncbi:MAG: PBSX family phage terminase large subunit [Provencibacterium sp.]|nr:PBSX family phage terminase large subunit [Provencibacterium sp.]
MAPSFFPVHRDIRAGAHTHYWLYGGRGSGKSSFASLEIIFGMGKDPAANAAVFRKVKDTLRDSVFAQLLWAIDRLGQQERWKASLSPMELRCLPTGQKILFRGLDRASKAKSLKTERGYFKFLWFEELEEFSGMAELRSVLQSVVRGGRQPCCLYTYNPPRSRRSWVNEEAAGTHPGRLCHHSDYRGMPPEWLGEEFLAEAAVLEAAQPELYRHEYLGEITGTGAEVFGNLELRAITDREIAGFASIERGLDFGYAADPLHYAVCHYDAARRRLYLFDELHLLRTSNARLGELIREEQRRHGRGAVCCDSAEPKSIDDLRLMGIAAYPAKKGPGSIGWGMRFLSEEVERIVIDPARCPNTAREFYGYALDLDGYGNAIPEYPDRENHAIDAVRYALERRIRLRFAHGGRKQGKEAEGF